MKNILPLLIICTALTSSVQAEWETVRHEGQDYVTARSIQKFYRFTAMEKRDGFLVLENKTVKMKLTIDGRDAYLNNVKFVFSFKILSHDERYLVSRIDLKKLIDPVLRPTYIKDAKPFSTVIIDPGHGGKDSGAVNRFGKEKDYNLSVAQLLKKELETRRFKVALTRDKDQTVSLNDRVAFANGIENAIFISLHFRSGGRGLDHGIQTYVLSPVGVPHPGRGLRQGDLQVQKGNGQDSANIALAAAVHGSCLLRTGRPDQGIRRARFSVLTGTKHPAILVETGNMSHAEEARLIHSEVYQQTVARAIADAVVKYRLSTTPRLPRDPDERN